MKVIFLKDPKRFQRLLHVAALVHNEIDDHAEGLVEAKILLPGLGLLRMLITEMEEMIYTSAGDTHTVLVDRARKELLDWIGFVVATPEAFMLKGQELTDRLIDACALKSVRYTDERLDEIIAEAVDDDPPPMFRPGDRNVN